MYLLAKLSGYGKQERRTALKFLRAIETARNRNLLTSTDREHVEHPLCGYLPALNGAARLAWGSAFIRGFSEFFEISEDEIALEEPLTWITLADCECITSDKPQEIDLHKFKCRYRDCLYGLNYLGM